MVVNNGDSDIMTVVPMYMRSSVDLAWLLHEIGEFPGKLERSNLPGCEAICICMLLSFLGVEEFAAGAFGGPVHILILKAATPEDKNKCHYVTHITLDQQNFHAAMNMRALTIRTATNSGNTIPSLRVRVVVYAECQEASVSEHHTQHPNQQHRHHTAHHNDDDGFLGFPPWVLALSP